MFSNDDLWIFSPESCGLKVGLVWFAWQKNHGRVQLPGSSAWSLSKLPPSLSSLDGKTTLCYRSLNQTSPNINSTSQVSSFHICMSWLLPGPNIRESRLLHVLHFYVCSFFVVLLFIEALFHFLVGKHRGKNCVTAKLESTQELDAYSFSPSLVSMSLLLNRTKKNKMTSIPLKGFAPQENLTQSTLKHLFGLEGDQGTFDAMHKDTQMHKHLARVSSSGGSNVICWPPVWTFISGRQEPRIGNPKRLLLAK